MKIRYLLAVLLLAGTASAQMPHQVAVLVNENSQASKKAANVFAVLHQVPACNLICLDLPESMFTGRYECSPDEFRTRIYEPAAKKIAERGLSDQIFAWVYSVDFPIRVVTAKSDRQQMSVMGLTFLRGEVPDLKQMEEGKVISPLFAGPGPDGRKLPSRALAAWAEGLNDQMPLPSMMLGYIGPNGNSIETVLRCIEDGVKARQNQNPARVLFVQTADEARSAPREWQFESTKAELEARGAQAVISTNTAPAQSRLAGVLTGQDKLKPSDYGSFVPGAMAEHFTSWSAEFQKPQTKCTEWLEAGATVTAGMVTEPYNNWVKFPHARFYAHYAAGCTALESFYQAVASPVQILLLGDPLSRIAALPVQIRPVGLSKEISGSIDAAFVADVKFPISVKTLYSALLDGKQIKPPEGNSLIELPFDDMADGYHDVRLIAQAGMPVMPGGWVDVPVVINKKGRSIELAGITDRDPRQIVAAAEVKGEEVPKSIELLWNGRTLAAVAPGEDLVFDEREIGEGPHRIQAVAVYADGMEVRSEPKQFGIEFNPAAE